MGSKSFQSPALYGRGQSLRQKGKITRRATAILTHMTVQGPKLEMLTFITEKELPQSTTAARRAIVGIAEPTRLERFIEFSPLR